MPRGYIPSDLLADARAGGRHLLVYAALESFCTAQKRECWPTRKSIALRARVSTKTVSRSISDLVGWGYVSIDRWRSSNLKSRNLYRLLGDTMSPRQTQDCETLGDTMSRRKGHHVPSKGTQGLFIGDTMSRKGSLTKAPNKGSKRKRKPTVAQAPPSTAEVAELMAAYATEKEIAIDTQGQAERFVDYWTDQGWRRRGGPMKSWEGSARTWLRNSADRDGVKASKPLPAGWSWGSGNFKGCVLVSGIHYGADGYPRDSWGKPDYGGQKRQAVIDLLAPKKKATKSADEMSLDEMIKRWGT